MKIKINQQDFQQLGILQQQLESTVNNLQIQNSYANGIFILHFPKQLLKQDLIELKQLNDGQKQLFYFNYNLNEYFSSFNQLNIQKKLDFAICYCKFLYEQLKQIDKSNLQVNQHLEMMRLLEINLKQFIDLGFERCYNFDDSFNIQEIYNYLKQKILENNQQQYSDCLEQKQIQKYKKLIMLLKFILIPQEQKKYFDNSNGTKLQQLITEKQILEKENNKLQFKIENIENQDNFYLIMEQFNQSRTEFYQHLASQKRINLLEQQTIEANHRLSLLQKQIQQYEQNLINIQKSNNKEFQTLFKINMDLSLQISQKQKTFIQKNKFLIFLQQINFNAKFPQSRLSKLCYQCQEFSVISINIKQIYQYLSLKIKDTQIKIKKKCKKWISKTKERSLKNFLSVYPNKYDTQQVISATNQSLFGQQNQKIQIEQALEQKLVSQYDQILQEKYVAVLQKLYSTNKILKTQSSFLKREKLLDMRTAYNYLGFDNLHKQMDFIHIAGTNGKGSTVLKTSQLLLQLKNLKVGQYQSPHVISFRERIKINNQMINKEFVVDNLEELLALGQQKNWQLKYFDYVTLLCFKYFKEMKVDVGVIEVGIGGLYDSTNVITPILSIITQIGFDHCNSLGYTLEQIAKHKSGIIKPNVPVVLHQQAQPREVFLNKANEANSQVFQTNEIDKNLVFFDDLNNDCIKNVVRALKTCYKEKYGEITDDIEQFALKERPLGRFSFIDEPKIKNKCDSLGLSHSPKYIIFDVGHNESGIESVMKKLQQDQLYKNLKKTVIYGASQTKDPVLPLEIISKYKVEGDNLFFVKANNSRAMDGKRIVNTYIKVQKRIAFENNNNQIGNESIQKFDESQFAHLQQLNEQDFNISNVLVRSLNSINERSLQQPQQEEIILVTGSFYIMKETLQFFGYDIIDDGFY